MNRMTWPLGVGDLLEDGLQALLELAAVLGAGEQRADVERDDAAVAQRLGHVAGDDALGEALDDRGLADAGLADQDGVVLGAAGEDLDDAADLVVAADHRVELAVLGGLREVAAELLERLVLVLGVLVGDAVRAADGLDRLRRRPSCVAPLRRSASPAADVWAASASSRCSVEMYSSLELAGLALGGAQDGEQLAADGRLGRRAPVMVGQLVERGVDVGADGLGAGAELAQHGHDDAVLLLEQDGEQVLGRGLGVVARGGEGDGGLERLLGLGREAVELHRLKISVGWTEIVAEDRRRFQSVVLRVVAAAAAASGVVAAASPPWSSTVGTAVGTGSVVGRGGGAWAWARRLRLAACGVGVAVAWRRRRRSARGRELARRRSTGSDERPTRWVESELAA